MRFSLLATPETAPEVKKQNNDPAVTYIFSKLLPMYDKHDIVVTMLDIRCVITDSVNHGHLFMNGFILIMILFLHCKI